MVTWNNVLKESANALKKNTKPATKKLAAAELEALSRLLAEIELMKAENFNNAQYGWTQGYLRSAGAPEELIERIAQQRKTFEDGTPMPPGIDIDTRLGGALSLGLRDGDFLKGGLMDNLEWGNYQPDLLP